MGFYLINVRETDQEEIVEVGNKVELLDCMDKGELSSISRLYDTEEELRKVEMIPDEPCSCCGSIYKTNYRNGEELRKNKLCFTCNFWLEKNKDTGKRRIIINGVKYVDGGNVNYVQEALINKRFVGHGGRLFKIQFLDTGEIFETNNLWSNGNIPKRFRDKLEDNAKFI